MPNLSIIMDGDGAFQDIPKDKIVVADKNATMRVTFLDGGMTSGLPSVAFLIPMPDGTFVFAETSLRLFQAAAAASVGRYGNL